MRFLECPPNETPGYIDEADIFYQNPNDWLNLEYHTIGDHRERPKLPTRIVSFDKLKKVL
jgi:hypothetical protein